MPGTDPKYQKKGQKLMPPDQGGGVLSQPFNPVEAASQRANQIASGNAAFATNDPNSMTPAMQPPPAAMPFLKRGPTRDAWTDPNAMTPAFGSGFDTSTQQMTGFKPGYTDQIPTAPPSFRQTEVASMDALDKYLASKKSGTIGGGGGTTQAGAVGGGTPDTLQKPNPYGGHVYTDPQGYRYNIPQDGSPYRLIDGPGPSAARGYFPNAGEGVRTFMGNVGNAMSNPGASTTSPITPQTAAQIAAPTPDPNAAGGGINGQGFGFNPLAFLKMLGMG